MPRLVLVAKGGWLDSFASHCPTGDIKCLGTFKPDGPFEHPLVGLLLAAYKRRLWTIVRSAPAWATEKILSASEHTGDDRAVLWPSKN